MLVKVVMVLMELLPKAKSLLPLVRRAYYAQLLEVGFLPRLWLGACFENPM
jgi:hypothetical protein